MNMQEYFEMWYATRKQDLFAVDKKFACSRAFNEGFELGMKAKPHRSLAYKIGSVVGTVVVGAAGAAVVWGLYIFGHYAAALMGF